MKSNLFFAFLFLCSFAILAEDNNPVITSVPSLTIAPDARAGAMGDVGAATSPDVNSQYWNPSKYVFMESVTGVSVSYTPWLRSLVDDIYLAYMAGYYKIDTRQSVSGSIRYFSLGDITLMSEFGLPQNVVSPYELAADIAYSRLLSEKLSASVGLRYISSGLGQNDENSGPGSAVAADVSTYYRTPIALSTGDGKLAFGLNISNLGSKISYSRGANYNFIPTNMRLGTSFDYPIDTYNVLTVSGDLNKLLVPSQNEGNTSANDNVSAVAGVFKSFNDAPGGLSEELREISWSLGAEYVYDKQFFVRGGYYNEDTYKGNRKYFTVGAGFKMSTMQIDAGYIVATTPSNPLDKTLRISLSFDMLGLKELVK